MPRNVAGVYSLPAVINPVVTGTTIATTWANPTLSDIANAITDSIDRQGRTTILANLKMSGFKHTGAAAASADGEYLVFNQSAAKLASLGLGVAAAAWGASVPSADIGPAGGFGAVSSTDFVQTFNSYNDGTNWRAKFTGVGSIVDLDATGDLSFFTLPSVAANAIQTPLLRLKAKGDGRLFGSGLHNNANPVTGSTDQYIASGTATLTLTNIGGTTGLAINTPCVWMRVGNVVTVSGAFFIQSTSGVANAVAVGVSLPIGSNFTTGNEGGGCASSPVGDYSITMDPVNDRAVLSGTQPTGASWLTGFHFTYEIK